MGGHRNVGVGPMTVLGSGESRLEESNGQDDKLIEAFDAINDRLGPGSIQFGPAAQAAAWRSSSAFRSPSYTTRWEDIPKVKT